MSEKPLASQVTATHTSAPQCFDPRTIPVALQEDLLRTKRFYPQGKWLSKWLYGCLLMCLILVLQVIYHERDLWQPRLVSYELFCQWFACDDYDAMDIDALQLGRISVYSHPDLDNVLLVNAMLENQSVRIQRLPALELLFTDALGRVIAARILYHQDYLAQNLTTITQIQPGEILDIAFELLDPGQEALGYQLRLLAAPTEAS